MAKTDMVQRVAAKAVIVHDGKILILREARTYDEGTNVGKYQLPGGRINPGESFFDGLYREVMEETGLDVVAIKPLFVSEWFPVIKGTPTHIVAMFYVCELASPAMYDAIRLSDEHDHHAWVSAKDVKDYPLLDSEKLSIHALLES